MNLVWLFDSKWFIYVCQLESYFKVVFVYEVVMGKWIQFIDGMVDVIILVWDQNGKYFYFLVSIDYGFNFGWLDMSFYDFCVNCSLYCLVLVDNENMLIMVESDEEEVVEKEEKVGEEEEEKGVKV